jgi:ubiquinone/menaquinone biosynthesis C-methylase UbiE
MRAAIPFSAEWDAMDFGCGTGLLTLQLAPYLDSIIGVDSSRGMLNKMEDKLQKSNIQKVLTMQSDLEKGELPDGQFHLITSAMTLHHVPQIIPLLKSLRVKLHLGGWIALADLETEDGSFHDDPTGVFHFGFSRDQLTEILKTSGFSDINISTATKIDKGIRSYPVFLVTARAT